MELNKKQQKEIDSEFNKWFKQSKFSKGREFNAVEFTIAPELFTYVYKKLIEMRIERDAALKAGQKLLKLLNL